MKTEKPFMFCGTEFKDSENVKTDKCPKFGYEYVNFFGTCARKIYL